MQLQGCYSIPSRGQYLLPFIFLVELLFISSSLLLHSLRSFPVFMLLFSISRIFANTKAVLPKFGTLSYQKQCTFRNES